MRSLGSVLGVVGLGLLLAGCATPAPPPADSSSPSSPESASPSPSAAAETFEPGAPANQCETANLSVALEGPDASAGHLHYRIVFTNNGPDCALEGYPKVTVRMSAGSAALGTAAVDDSNTTPSIVTLPTGGTAVALLSAVNIDPGGGPLGDQCGLEHGDGYGITPPHSLQPILLQAADVPACSNPVAWMTVGPVTAG